MARSGGGQDDLLAAMPARPIEHDDTVLGETECRRILSENIFFATTTPFVCILRGCVVMQTTRRFRGSLPTGNLCRTRNSYLEHSLGKAMAA